MRTGDTFPELVAIMERLLAPNGCPWDREQTLSSLRAFLLEETYEVLDVMESADVASHREELGDLLMQIVFQAALRAREKAFDIDDVVRGINDKLVRRHPHVFATTERPVETTGQVLAQWAEIKAKEKTRGTLDGVPRSLPALARAASLTDRAAHVGFDWPDAAGPRAKVDEELCELDEARAKGAPANVEAELGDVLFALVNLARKLGVDAEAALRGANARFVARFEHVERRLREQGRSPRESNLEEMDALWDEAKKNGV